MGMELQDACGTSGQSIISSSKSNQQQLSSSVLFIGDSAAIYEALLEIFNRDRVVLVSARTLSQHDWPQQRDKHSSSNVTTLVWELPRFSTTTGSRQDRRNLDRIKVLLDSLLMLPGRSSPSVYIMAPRSSSTWACPAVMATTSLPGMTQSEHAWCAFGCVDANGSPIQAITLCYSSPPLASIRCRCVAGKQHTPAASLRPGRSYHGERCSDLWASNLRLLASGLVKLIHRQSNQITGDSVRKVSFTLPGLMTGADSILTNSTNVTTTATLTFPTSSKERQKAKEKASKSTTDVASPKPKRKTPLKCEENWDDCGTNLGGLGKDVLLSSIFDSSSDSDTQLEEDVLFEEQWCYPSRWLFSATPISTNLGVRNIDDHSKLFNCMEAIWVYASRQPVGMSICEIAGGEARCSRVCCRLRLSVGRNFDLVAGCDLQLASEREAFRQYRRRHKPLVLCMSPICGPHGGWSRLNSVIHPDKYQASLKYALVLGSFCGEMALAQYEDGRDWLNEQSASSTLYQHDPWPKVRAHPRTVVARFDQCQLGAVTAQGEKYKKETCIWASDFDLVYYLDGLVCGTIPRACNGNHIELTGKKLSQAQVWTWQLATRLAWGIARLVQRRRWQGRHYFNDDDTSMYFPDGVQRHRGRALEDVDWRACPGCRGNRPADHIEHSRIRGQCRFDEVAPRDYTCPACSRNLPADHETHTNDDNCRNPGRRRRAPPGLERQPREVGVRRAVGVRGDPRVMRDDPPLQPSGGAGGSSSSSSNRPAAPPDAPEPSSGVEGPIPAVPHGQRRSLRYGDDERSRDQRSPLESFGDEDQLWGPSDLKQVVRLLNDKDESIIRKQLRRLHLRWTHASIAQMKHLLTMLGCSFRAIELIPEVVDSCRICRMWAPKAPAVKTTARLSTRFNQCVQADLLFYSNEFERPVNDYILLHMICEAIKWSEVHETPSKNAEDLIRVMTDSWFRRYGAPEMLIWDGEGALDSDEAKRWSDLWSFELIVRPVDKAAWIAERHHQIFRVQLHKTTAQLHSENLVVPFTNVVSSCQLAKNAMLQTGHGTPYQSLLGRTPRLLPQIVDVVGSAHLDDERGEEGVRAVHRLREVSVGAAVQAMAEHRAALADSSRTPLAGETLGLKPGDDVEIYRQPPTKDRPGWVGPAKVTDIGEMAHGKVTVRWQGRHLDVSLESVRRAMILFFLLNYYPTTNNRLENTSVAMQVLIDAANTIHGRYVILGRVQTTRGWHTSAESHKFKLALHALFHTAWSHWRVSGCLGGTLAHSVKMLPALSAGAIGSKILFWKQDTHNAYSVAETHGPDAVQVEKVLELERGGWQHIRLIQWHLYRSEIVEAARDDDPSVAQLGSQLGGDLDYDQADTVTIEEGSSIQSIGGDHDDAMGDYDDPLFWSAWKAEIEEAEASGNLPESELEDITMWTSVTSMTEPPDAQYSLDAFSCRGMQYVHAVSEVLNAQLGDDFTPSTSPDTHTVQKQLLDVQQTVVQSTFPLERLQQWQDEEDMAELQVPVWLAAASGYGAACEYQFQYPDDDSAVAVFQVDKAGVKKMIIETSKAQSNANVSDDELKSLDPAVVVAAVLAELERWVQNAAVRRQKRHLARNLVTSRYVFTWKLQKDGSRILKCRLTVHGFKDNEKASLERYSATVTRWGQRMVTCTSVQSAWPMASLDISQAFLKGLSFDEIEEQTGKRREVSLVLPKGRPGIEPSGNVVLRRLPGFETFSDALEVLEMLKGGFGLIDAPSLFTRRVDAVFKAEALVPTTSEGKLYVKHEANCLTLMTSAHMDDFQATGTIEKLTWLHNLLKKHFGDDVKMTLSKSFTHTGIHHTLSDDFKRCELDQHDYAAALRPVSESSFRQVRDDEDLSELLHAAFMCLLGGGAWLLLTRLDVAVYISALQRASKKPRGMHLRRLNRVIRYIQRTKKPLVYEPLPLPVVLLSIADSAFKSPDPAEACSENAKIEPTVMRGYILALAHCHSESKVGRKYSLQLLDYVAGKQSHVTRGVWSSELYNQCDALGKATVLLGFLEEVRLGPQPAARLIQLQQSGSYEVGLEMVTDSMSIFRALESDHLKVPTEKGTLYHVAYCMEALRTGLVRRWLWCDTRDMAVDGLTKGLKDRSALHALMAGKWSLAHAVEILHGQALHTPDR